MGIPSKVVGIRLGAICRDEVVFTKMYLFLHLLEELIQILSLGSSVAKKRTYSQIFDIMSTF